MNDKKYKLIINTKPKGLRKCSNIALKNSKGKYIIRLDADDKFSKNGISLLVNYMIKNESKDLVYGNWKYIDKNNNIIGSEKVNINEKNVVKNLAVHGACTLVKTESLKK